MWHKNRLQERLLRGGGIGGVLMAEASEAFRGVGVRDSETFLRSTLTDSFPALFFFPPSLNSGNRGRGSSWAESATRHNRGS